MKKFLRGILYWGINEVIMLPISLINLLFVFPIFGIYYRINGEVDSFKEYWMTLFNDVIPNRIKIKNTVVKYGLIEGFKKCEEDGLV